MAFCKACGKEVVDTAVICPGCGSETGVKKEVEKTSRKWSNGKFAAFIVLGILLPIIGTIMGIIGLTQEENRQNGGICLGVSLVSWILWASVL